MFISYIWQNKTHEKLPKGTWNHNWTKSNTLTVHSSIKINICVTRLLVNAFLYVLFHMKFSHSFSQRLQITSSTCYCFHSLHLNNSVMKIKLFLSSPSKRFSHHYTCAHHVIIIDMTYAISDWLNSMLQTSEERLLEIHIWKWEINLHL